MKFKKLVFCLSLVVPVFLQAQDDEKEKIKQIEIQKEFDKQRAISKQLDSAVYFIENEHYQKADVKLKYVLKNIRSVPSDLAFYFGKNSFYLVQYKQSVDWLNKYIQLKGTTGKFSEEAVMWLKKAEEELLKERQKSSDVTKEILSRDYDIDCGPTGNVTCPVCKGSTVIVKKDYFGDKYKTCGYCNKLGYLNCQDYNKLLRGQLQPVQ